mmetsp:Transcript_29813/g.58517  ORF Transcript_29813/g.58517 Transcript_29813/m.58517 type:complete len:101 (-) Transcript_29813:177-479(-)
MWRKTLPYGKKATQSMGFCSSEPPLRSPSCMVFLLIHVLNHSDVSLATEVKEPTRKAVSLAFVLQFCQSTKGRVRETAVRVPPHMCFACDSTQTCRLIDS